MESPPERSTVSALSTTELVQSFINSGTTETPVNILDLDEIVHNYQRWKDGYPYAMPFFLPSVNNHPKVLTLLSKLGLGFSCASIVEMRTALKSGVPSDRVILAHPAKTPETILYAKQKDIRRIVCDSVLEIGKVHRLYPTAQLILRVRVFSEQKFGCCPTEGVREIFNYAKSAETVNIVGVQVVVPSKSVLDKVETLHRALLIAKVALDQATSAGLSDIRQLMLSGAETVSAAQLQQALAEFNFDPALLIIVETERQLVQSAVTLVTSVQSKRVIRQAGTVGPIQEIMYFINDGRYGSFEWWNEIDKHPVVFRTNETVSTAATHPSSLWGPSCDSADIVCKRLELPELEIGDFLVFPGMGAYGVTLASCFNGFPIPKTIVCASLETTRALVGDLLSDD